MRGPEERSLGVVQLSSNLADINKRELLKYLLLSGKVIILKRNYHLIGWQLKSS